MKQGLNMPSVFVFGSNLAGRHGRGAAQWAVRHRGAKYGCGFGRQGYAFAIPTKDENLSRLSLDAIKPYVDKFLEHARQHPAETFEVTAIGCGLSGYSPAEIAPMFRGAPPNCELPDEFRAVLEAEHAA